MHLGVSHCHEPGLQFLDRAIGVPFHLEHPFQFNDLAFLRPGNKGPRLHSEKRGGISIMVVQEVQERRKETNGYPKSISHNFEVTKPV
jgi:hypothetical protein